MRLGIYRHYKGNFYKVLSIAKHTETHDDFVIYQSLNENAEIWARPKTMFLEEVEFEGKRQPRFQYVESNHKNVQVIKKKVWIPYFEKVLSGEKTYELRLNDWDVQVGDILILQEWDHTNNTYTGREVAKTVGYVGTFKYSDLSIWWKEEQIQAHGLQIISLKD